MGQVLRSGKCRRWCAQGNVPWRSVQAPEEKVGFEESKTKRNKTKQQGGTRGLLLALRKKIHPSQVPSKTRDSKVLLLLLHSSHFPCFCALPLWWKGDTSTSTPLLFRVTAAPECIYHLLFLKKKLNMVHKTMIQPNLYSGWPHWDPALSIWSPSTNFHPLPQASWMSQV